MGSGWLEVSGVQGMLESERARNLEKFRSGCRVLVATSSLEEGLDIPSCRFVVRYDYFNSAKSHVQGSGRARQEKAEVFYFENQPVLEEERRLRVEAVAKEMPVPPPADQKEHEGSLCPQGGRIPGIGSYHKWGEELTLWDYASNKSFRGMLCLCGARLHIASRGFGKNRKKKLRSFSLEGPNLCPKSDLCDLSDPRLQGIDPETGIQRA